MLLVHVFLLFIFLFFFNVLSAPIFQLGATDFPCSESSGAGTFAQHCACPSFANHIDHIDLPFAKQSPALCLERHNVCGSWKVVGKEKQISLSPAFSGFSRAIAAQFVCRDSLDALAREISRIFPVYFQELGLPCSAQLARYTARRRRNETAPGGDLEVG